MSGEKHPTMSEALLLDYEFVQDMAKQPGFWGWVEREIETLRGGAPDSVVDDLQDGMRRMRERALVPPEQREADPVYSRTEILVIMAVFSELMKERFGRDFFCIDDLKEQKPEVYDQCRGIDISLTKSSARRLSEVLVLLFEFAAMVHRARYGAGLDLYLERLNFVIEGLRDLYTPQQLEALIERIKTQLEGKFGQ